MPRDIIKSFMPFALLPSLLSLIIIHLPPTTLSCDVLSLCLSLSHPLPLSLSLTLTPPPSPPRTYNTQHSHSLFCLDFRLHTLFPFPSLSLSLVPSLERVLVLLPWERRTSAARGKGGRKEKGRKSRSLGWVESKGKRRKRKKGKRKEEKKRKRRERESNRALTVWDNWGC